MLFRSHHHALGLVRGRWGLFPHFIVENSHSLTSLPSTYDLVHIDADHTKEGVLQDLCLVCNFLREDWHIVCHDTDDPNITKAIAEFAAPCKFEVTPMPFVKCGVKVIHCHADMNSCRLLQGLREEGKL